MIHKESWYKESLIDFGALQRQKTLLDSLDPIDPVSALAILKHDSKADLDEWWPEDYDHEENRLLEAGELLEQLAPAHNAVRKYHERGEIAPKVFLDDLEERVKHFLSNRYDVDLLSYLQEHYGVDMEALPHLSQAQEFMEEYGDLLEIAENLGEQGQRFKEWLSQMWDLAYKLLQHPTTHRKGLWEREWKEWEQFWKPRLVDQSSINI